MNVVSKVGSLITQGVYSVATPFHPFGGAVDIIVVEQEDGTYRSTPWYVRFGKFQGVLKGAEKIVHISVNGNEANFHMLLDNSGEAYFVREEPVDEETENEGQVCDESDNIQDNDKPFEFHAEHGLDGNAASSTEYTYRYGSISEVDDLVKSEMVLVSVDGHVLTAPISANEETVENVQLTTPQFHLGPVEMNGENLLPELNASDPDVTNLLVVENDMFLGCPDSDLSSNGKCGDSLSLLTAADDSHTDDNAKVVPESVMINMHIESHQEQVIIQNSESSPGSVSLSLQSLDMNVDVQSEPIVNTQEQSSTQEEPGKEGTLFSMGFEISLCGNFLRAGMGLKAADEAFNARRISKEEFESSTQTIIKNKHLIVRFKGKYLSWDMAAPILLGKAAFGLEMPIDSKNCIFIEDEGSSEPSPRTVTMSPSSRSWRLWPIPFRRVKTLQHTESSSSSDEVFLDSDSFLHSPSNDSLASPRVNGGQSPGKHLVRTYIPTTEQISSLNLKDGQNTIAFSFSTRVLGRQQVDAHVYLWKWNARIVISDVDGTITKSDVLGQVMPLVGRDWTQSGVARLFSAIKENGYQLLFLSARAIVQAYLTRSFLLNLKQDGKALPNGPVVISPDGLLPSLYREVVRRTPHEFKIACLEDIRALFPAEYNPFYAGFGNRDTDELSYRKIGIPKGKVFIINPKGEVAVNHCVDVKSYTSLHTLVNDMFPPTSVAEQEDFNSWNYWKMPLPSVDC